MYISINHVKFSRVLTAFNKKIVGFGFLIQIFTGTIISLLSICFTIIFGLNVGRMACKLFDRMRKEAAAVKIQKHFRRYHARKKFRGLHISVLVLQTGLRAMAARKEFRFRKQTKAATIIQVKIVNIKQCG